MFNYITNIQSPPTAPTPLSVIKGLFTGSGTISSWNLPAWRVSVWRRWTYEKSSSGQATLVGFIAWSETLPAKSHKFGIVSTVFKGKTGSLGGVWQGMRLELQKVLKQLYSIKHCSLQAIKTKKTQNAQGQTDLYEKSKGGKDKEIVG